MPVLARAFLLLVLVLGVVGSVVLGIATRRVGRVYDIAPLAIARATAPDEIARGERLFRTLCFDCHAGRSIDAPAPQNGLTPRPDQRRPIGARVTGAPSFLGELWAPNLTGDVRTGIGAWSDGELARLLRNGVRRDGRYAATMPRFARLADDDVAALIGFLRSPHPLVAPTAHEVPRLGLGLAGTLALAFAAGVDVRGERNVAMPPRSRDAAYGRYLAASVYACVDCHTEGFSNADEKLRSPQLLAGGQFQRTPDGQTIYSPNLTSHPGTGLRLKTPDALARLLATGISADHLPARPPMPVFRHVTDDEAAALFAFLRAVPPVERKTPGLTREPPTADSAADRLFVTLGCGVCHGRLAPPNELLRRAALWPAATIAAAIRHPELNHPDTQMPTYADVVDDPTALRLAEWLRATGGRNLP